MVPLSVRKNELKTTSIQVEGNYLNPAPGIVIRTDIPGQSPQGCLYSVLPGYRL